MQRVLAEVGDREGWEVVDYVFVCANMCCIHMWRYVYLYTSRSIQREQLTHSLTLVNTAVGSGSLAGCRTRARCRTIVMWQRGPLYEPQRSLAYLQYAARQDAHRGTSDARRMAMKDFCIACSGGSLRLCSEPRWSASSPTKLPLPKRDDTTESRSFDKLGPVCTGSRHDSADCQPAARARRVPQGLQGCQRRRRSGNSAPPLSHPAGLSTLQLLLRFHVMAAARAIRAYLCNQPRARMHEAIIRDVRLITFSCRRVSPGRPVAQVRQIEANHLHQGLKGESRLSL